MTDHRPQAHLRPVTGWMNDPTGPVRWRGRFHLFHQYNPNGGFWDRPHWGHLVSEDLVHWQRRPIALSPEPDGPDRDGCFSGCVVIDGSDAVIVYTGVQGPPGPDQVQATCLARSQDPWLDHWKREATNPVTEAPQELDLLGFRDPFVWQEDGMWWQLVGSGIAGIGGAALLYRSDDLVRWHPVGPLLTSADLREVDPHEWTGAMWECPALLRGSKADALIISVHDETTTHHPLAIVGRLEGTRFLPRAMQRLDLGPDIYAPCLYPDGDGAAILWAWSWEARTQGQQRADGWAGTLTWPRRIELRDDRIRTRPLPELTALRASELAVEPRPTADGWRAHGVSGDALDLELTLGGNVDRIDLRLRCAPDASERTTLTIDRAARELWMDRDHASLDPRASGGRFGGPVTGDGALDHIRVVLDRSIIEVFVDDEVAMTARVYPTREDSIGVEVAGCSQAVADVVLRAWSLGSIWLDGDGS